MNFTHPTPYPERNDVLDEFVDNVQAILGASFMAPYLRGCFAVGDFDPQSDMTKRLEKNARLRQVRRQWY
jgi:hypothetical protein